MQTRIAGRQIPAGGGDRAPLAARRGDNPYLRPDGVAIALVADKAQGEPMIRCLGKIEQKVRRTAIGGYNCIDASIVVCSLQPATKRRFYAIHDELHFLLHPQCGRS